MSDTYLESTQSPLPKEKGHQKPTRTLTFEDILNPVSRPNDDTLPVSLGDPSRRVRFLDVPTPPESVPLYAPYRVNNLISAAQLFENRPYLKVAASPVQRAATPPRKTTTVPMTSISVGTESRASSDAAGISRTALSASGDQEETQVPMVTQIASQKSCLRPQLTRSDGEKGEAGGGVSASPGQPATHAVPSSAETTRLQEGHVFIPGLDELRNMVKSFLVNITEKHDPVSRESREDYAMYRGRVMNSREIQDYLRMKASQKYTGVAESRILKREAEVLDGLVTQAQRVFELSRHIYENSELASEAAEILKTVDALCDAISSQWTAIAAASTPSMNLTTVRNIDLDIGVTRPASRTASSSGPVADPLAGGMQHQHQQDWRDQRLMGLIAEHKKLQSQNKDLLSQVESLKKELDQARKL